MEFKPKHIFRRYLSYGGLDFDLRNPQGRDDAKTAVTRLEQMVNNPECGYLQWEDLETVKVNSNIFFKDGLMGHQEQRQKLKDAIQVLKKQIDEFKNQNE